MPGTYGQPIVEIALALRRSHPKMTAMSVLDVAMAGNANTHPDFECIGQEFDDWLTPPSPFAELLREAFAPYMTQQELIEMVAYEGDCDPLHHRWQHDVIDRFAARYNLWS